MRTRGKGAREILLLLFMVGVIMAMALMGCAPTIRAIPDEVMKDEALKAAYDKGREEGRRDAGVLAKQELEEQLGGFVRKYRDEMLYLELVKGGVLKPAQVSMVYIPGKVSEDGGTFSAPSLSWKVVSPPQFVPDESTRWMNKDRANFCYFLIETFNTEKDAYSFVGRSQKPPAVFLSSVSHGDSSGKWAVIGKTMTGNCTNAMNFYKGKGHHTVRIE